MIRLCIELFSYHYKPFQKLVPLLFQRYWEVISISHILKTHKKKNLITILLIFTNRLILLPIIGLITVLLLDYLGIMTDLCELFILFITFCTPSAITILDMAKQYQQQLEDVVSLMLFYGYILCIITLPVWMTIYLAIFQPKK
ncbi:unnamed protein product [Paramecium pentaurelia]|uniref:Membrane transport protein n=1 Tax=Paramecium pentaurelia TaxID=43138 RepID=A0A8S1YGL7_9CILI|nr:unnamed protein product [Paramecium pentaurelia]